MARRRRPLGPKGALFLALFFYAFCAVWAAITVSGHAQAVQSSYVQTHGQRDSATVVSVDNIEHTHKNSTTYTALVTVQLQQPVNGTASSVVHVPYKDNSFPGDKITVFVDPSQPGYSELPGSPNATTAGWVASLVGTVVFLVIAVFLTRQSVRLFRRRRAVRDFA
jgi:flagellar biosynthesis/type III secretory pathway M-ring protein FliF/YscJ